jgi:1-acyl-sn-glycerol-3-phosphate acyltransferase
MNPVAGSRQQTATDTVAVPSRASSTLRHAWRVVRTALAFVVFGIGAVMIGLLVLPVLRLRYPQHSTAGRRLQLLIHHAFRLFAWLMVSLRLIRVTWTGKERLRARPLIVVANHPTLIDVVLLVAAMPQADCIVKSATRRNPLFHRIVEGAGYIPNDEPSALIAAGTERLRHGGSLLLFPEGTRSPAGRLGAFHRGAARIALRSGIDLVPVVITCAPPTLMRGQRWYDVPERTAHVILTVNDPICVRHHPPAQRAEAARARELTASLERFYQHQLQSSP